MAEKNTDDIDQKPTAEEAVEDIAIEESINQPLQKRSETQTEENTDKSNNSDASEERLAFQNNDIVEDIEELNLFTLNEERQLDEFELLSEYHNSNRYNKLREQRQSTEPYNASKNNPDSYIENNDLNVQNFQTIEDKVKVDRFYNNPTKILNWTADTNVADRFTPTDTNYDDQWHYDLVGDVEAIWADYTGNNITVGHYDNGIEKNHYDIAPNYNDDLEITLGNGHFLDPSYGFNNETETLSNELLGTILHGTSTGGLISAAANGLGIVGMAFESDITTVDVFSYPTALYSGSGTPEAFFKNHTTELHEAIRAMDRFDITNNSWGEAPNFNYSGPPTANRQGTVDSFEHVAENGRGSLGTISVKANGNTYGQYETNANAEMANATRFTISVSAYADDGFAAVYANRGANTLLSAASNRGFDSNGDATGGIVSSDLVGSYTYVPDGNGRSTDGISFLSGGTSSATPQVTGTVALMLEANSNLGWRDVQSILANSARHVGGDFNGGIDIDNRAGTEAHSWYYNGANDWNGGGKHFSEDYGYGALDTYNAVRMAETWSLFTPAQTSTNEDVFTINGNFSPISITTNSPAEFTSTNVIEDMNIEYIDVTLSFTHASMRQLQVTLISPDNTSVVLFDATSDSADAYTAVADAGFTWTFGVNALRGENTQGEWKILIEDEVGDTNVGQLLDVDISFYGQSSVNHALEDDLYHYTNELRDLFNNQSMNNAARSEISDTDGEDWINMSAVSGNIDIDINEGQDSLVTFFNQNSGAETFNFMTIATGTVIENVITGDGNDIITGNSTDNDLYGMRGHDLIKGGAGNDKIYGGKGNDSIWGQEGADDLYGGEGSDEFNIESLDGTFDTVHDFDSSEDVINIHNVLDGIGIAEGSDILEYLRIEEDSDSYDLFIDTTGDAINNVGEKVLEILKVTGVTLDYDNIQVAEFDII
jgi:subtilisin-like proprotein convertase family protein